jgi:hypothetical protein
MFKRAGGSDLLRSIARRRMRVRGHFGCM